MDTNHDDDGCLGCVCQIRRLLFLTFLVLSYHHHHLVRQREEVGKEEAMPLLQSKLPSRQENVRPFFFSLNHEHV